MTLSERIGAIVGRDRPGRYPIDAFARYAAENSSDARLSMLCGLLAGTIEDEGAITLAARAIRIHGGWSPEIRRWLDEPHDERSVMALVIEHGRIKNDRR